MSRGNKLLPIPDEVIEIAKGIKDMKIRGAGSIAINAAKALLIAAEKFQGEDSEFSDYIKEVGKMLIRTRPTAVSLPNAVFFILNRMGELPEKQRNNVISAATEFIERTQSATQTLAIYGSKLIENGFTVMTHCHSTAVVSTLIAAWKNGTRFKVINTETRPRFQGRITATLLAQSGIPVTHIPDSSIRYHMNSVDLVIVGADTVTSDGHLINKVGTSILALSANEAGIPFYSATESIKFSPATLVGGQVIIEEREGSELTADNQLLNNKNIVIKNPAFDITPPEHISGFITEYGIIPPRASSLIIKYVFGITSGFMQLKLIEEE